MLKKIKNIEAKNEQQLDLIRDQNEKQLDLIGKTNTDKTKKIEYYDAKNKTAVDLVNKIKKEIRDKKKIKTVSPLIKMVHNTTLINKRHKSIWK